MRAIIFCGLLLFSVASLAAQPRHGDKTVQHGDTTVCQHFKKDRLLREDFYLHKERIFSRHWSYNEDGSGIYGWQQKLKKGRYAKANGPAVSYFADGKLRSVQTFQGGKQVGDCLEYYPSGLLQLRCHHAQGGAKDGIRITYYESGLVQSKVRWVKGRMLEILRYQDAQGNELAVGSFQNGTGDWIWYDKGHPVLAYVYKNGRQVRTKILIVKDKTQYKL